MNPYVVLIADSLVIVLSLILGTSVLARNHKQKINILFGLISIAFAVWSICLLFYEFTLIYDHEFWIKATFIAVSSLVILTLAFSFIYPRTVLKQWRRLAWLFSSLFIMFTGWMLYFTDYWIVGVVETHDRGIQTILGLGYKLWLVPMWLGFVWALINFYYNYRHSIGLYRAQLKYLFLGFALWGLGVNIPDVIMPLLFGTTEYFSISPVSSLFFSLAVGYVILKHRMMDIRLVIARSLAYFLLTLTVLVLSAFSLFAISSWIFPNQSIYGDQLIISAVVSLIIAYILQPLRYWLEKKTEHIFFKENYDPEIVLNSISKILSSTINLHMLADKVLEVIKNNLYFEYCHLVLLRDSDQPAIEQIIGSNSKDYTGVYKDLPLNRLMAKNRDIWIFDDIDESPLKLYMRDNNIGALAQLKAKNQIVGLLVCGNKKNGAMYLENDIRVLSITGPQMAISIENARQFEEIQQFSERLKQKVKEATEQLSQANERLKELDKRKNEFINVAAHELRAPLTAVKGYLSMIAEGDAGKIPHQMEEFIQGALDGAEREVRLVNNMLNVSRIEEGRLVYQMGKVDLAKVVKDTFEEFMKNAQDKQLEYTLDIQKSIKDSVWVDQDRIHEVVANLISNALKYTDKGQVKVTLTNIEDKVRFEVNDTGLGMTPDEVKQLFAKFYRANSSAGKVLGTGLGLYITKLLIEKFDGTIGVDSEVEKGSRFWFELPISGKSTK